MQLHIIHAPLVHSLVFVATTKQQPPWMHSCFALSGLTVSGLFSDGLHALSLDLSTRREHRKSFFFQGTSEFYVPNSNMSKYKGK